MDIAHEEPTSNIEETIEKVNKKSYQSISTANKVCFDSIDCRTAQWRFNKQQRFGENHKPQTCPRTLDFQEFQSIGQFPRSNLFLIVAFQAKCLIFLFSTGNLAIPSRQIGRSEKGGHHVHRRSLVISIRINLTFYIRLNSLLYKLKSKRDYEVIFKVIDNLRYLLFDDNVNVQKRAYLAMINIFKNTLKVLIHSNCEFWLNLILNN